MYDVRFSKSYLGTVQFDEKCICFKLWMVHKEETTMPGFNMGTVFKPTRQLEQQIYH